MATKAQIAANRKNAKKSTGPKSLPGKDKTKLNGLKHGLCSDLPVLPSENPARFRAFVEAWLDDWNPTTMARAQLVKEAAIAAWRKERCVRAEANRLGKRIRETVGRWRTQEERAVDEAVASLADDPRAAVTRLMATRAGVDRMVAMWTEIADAAAPGGWSDVDAHHFRTIFLCGRMPGDDDAVGLRDDSWRLLLRNAPEEADPELPLEPWTDAEAAEVAAGLRALALGRIADLRAARDRLPDPLPTWLAQAEADAMLPRPEDALLLRYETQRSREFHRALGDLTKMAQTGSDLAATEADEEAPDEAGAEKPDATPSTPGTSEELASVGNTPSSTGSAVVRSRTKGPQPRRSVAAQGPRRRGSASERQRLDA